MGVEVVDKNIDGVKIYNPPENISTVAHISNIEKYKSQYKSSIESPDEFWSEMASEFYWHKKWTYPIFNYNFDMKKGPIHIQWFPNAETNICYNCIDRHIENGKGENIAFYWEGNDPSHADSLTYNQLLIEVSKCANWLKTIGGINKNDDVTIYMPMINALPIAMLACARIGAVHSVVFGGFSAVALADRIIDSKPKVVITATGVMRGSKAILLKEIVDDALKICEENGFKVNHCLIYDHIISVNRDKVNKFNKEEVVVVEKKRDHWWQDEVSHQSDTCPIEWFDSEHPLFKLYTSGSTGKPKGVLHTTGGYMVGTAITFKYVFDYHENDVYWCTADCGWITGHSYVTYGPMLNGATQVIFEGVPTYPDAGRCWQIIDKYKVNQFYTAPTAIRSLMTFGDAFVTKYSRSSLKVLGTVGEPINPAAWDWYYKIVGNEKCPIMDTWWQTEGGSHMITPLPGAIPLKPGSATLPFFGIEIAVLDSNGHELEGECSGYLVIKKPWPSIMRTVSGNHERFEETYFKTFNGYYMSGDGCHQDKDGYIWITGRVDDVINVSGHRIGSAEIESALVSHPKCAEAAVVPCNHAIKGQGIYVYVTLINDVSYDDDSALKKELRDIVRSTLGPIATPDFIQFVPGLPKTRSGKIMRRILRKIAVHEENQIGDVSTLADSGVVDDIIKHRET